MSFCLIKRSISVHPNITPSAPCLPRLSIIDKKAFFEDSDTIPKQSSLNIVSFTIVRSSSFGIKTSIPLLIIMFL